MESLNTTATRALRTLLAGQPASAAKVAFAWQMIAGPAIARASTIAWERGTVRVRPSTAEWRREIVRAKPILLDRLRHMLGSDVVRTLIVDEP
jgi:hypothetical protein